MSYAAFAKKNIPRADIPEREKPPKQARPFQIGDQIRVTANPSNSKWVERHMGQTMVLTYIVRDRYYAGLVFLLYGEFEHA